MISDLPRFLINGESCDTVSVRDRGLQYGDGLFETIRIVEGGFHYWDEHIARLEMGCQKLAIHFPGENLLLREAISLIHPSACGVLKIIITRGSGERGYRVDEAIPPNRVILLDSAPQYPAKYYSAGIALRLCAQRLGHNPQLAGIKHLNRLEQVMARREWGDDFQEGLMLDQFDQVAEGTMSNVFIIDGQTLVTPTLENCGVHGIIRDQIIRQANGLGIKVRLANFTQAQLMEADAVFLSNSIIGIWPVQRFANRSWKLHPLVVRLQTAIGVS